MKERETGIVREEELSCAERRHLGQDAEEGGEVRTM